MPITIKSNLLKVRDNPNSDYLSIDAVSDSTTAERVQQIANAATTAQAQIESKKNIALSQITSVSDLQDIISETYSDTKTYSVGDYVIYNDNLYRCTTEITTAETWNDAHWTQVVFGSEVSDLKSAVALLGLTVFTGHEQTKNGITFTWDCNDCTINGTSTSITWYDLITPINTIPDWLEPGEKYQVYFNSSNPNVALILYYTTDGGNTWPQVFNTQSNIESVTIPANATGFLLRIWVANGTTMDNLTVTPMFVKLNEQSPYIPRQNLINKLPFNYGVDNKFKSCDSVTISSVLFNSSSGNIGNLSDFPFGQEKPGWLITLPSSSDNKTILLQFAVLYSAPNKMMMRSHTFGGWTDWRELTQDIDIESLLMNQGSLYPAGISLNQIKKVSTPDTISIEYDFDRNMYHVVGTTPSATTYMNFALINNALPKGMNAGETYNFVVHVEDQQDVKNPSFGSIEFFTTTTGDGNWQILASVYSNRFNTVIPLKIPDGTNGILARFASTVAREYDFYFSVQITPQNVIPQGAIANVLTSYFENLQMNYTYSSCDDVTETCALFVSSSAGVKTIQDYPINDAGWLLTYPASSLNLQFAVGYTNGKVMTRRKLFSGWTSWTQVSGITSYLPGCDLDTLVNGNYFYLLIDSEEYENMPLSGLKAGFLEIKQSGNWCKQFFYALTEGKSWVRTFSNGVKKTDWVLSEGGNGNTYNVTQEISRDTYQNTYNITTSPQITTDSNGWLQAVDNESTDEANATDMTGPIMSMLNSTGYCKLGPGTFYVSGNINMPNNAMLEGCGNKTIVRLLSSVTSGYIVRLTQYNTVKDIRFSGGKSIPTNLYTDGTNLGSRHGIYLIANADNKEDAQPQALQNFITNCFFDNFDGSAFYTHNTGGGLQNSVTFTDSYITHCRVGINIDYYAEYGKYSQIITFQCYYACINNGGNNVFTGCTFHGVVGWLTDNSGNDKSNNQHGSCVGCTFNHIDNMNNPGVLGNGKAVHIINGVAGFIFTGCHLWYGNVYIENSQGVQFSDCLFGNNAIEIQVTGSYPAFFFDNIFWTTPTLDVITGCKFEGNHLKSGASVEP